MGPWLGHGPPKPATEIGDEGQRASSDALARSAAAPVFPLPRFQLLSLPIAAIGITSAAW